MFVKDKLKCTSSNGSFMKVEKDSKWLFIPIEVKVRELLAKTLLACVAAERGFNVVLGEAHTVRDTLHMLPAGILMEKGVAPSEEEKFTRFIEQGNRIVSWCEEGLVFFNDDDYVKRKITRDDLNQVDYFFAWGRHQANVIKVRFPEMESRIILSGNPRLDLLRPEYRNIFNSKVDKLKSKYGKFILVNSNFQHCNHKNGDGAYVGMLKQQGRLAGKQDENFAWDWIAHKEKLFDSFIPMIRSLRQNFPNYRVIVRPHPGENHETWRQLFVGDDGIEVTHEGGVIPWVIASSVLIHNGCTTGIEAALLDHPAIAYRPVLSNTYDQYLPNSVNYCADSESELLKSLDLLLNKQQVDQFINNPQWRKVLSKFVSGINGASACETIIDKVEVLHHGIKSINRRPWFTLHQLDLKKYVEAVSLINKILSRDTGRGEYSLHKFKGLECGELEADVRMLKEVSGNFGSVKVRKLKDDVFLFSSGTY
jgi:surface carbohydrate biosynthesis protein